MPEGILHRHMLQLLIRLAAEGTARGRQKDLLNLVPRLALKGLENRAVLAVHRENLYPLLLCQRHDDMAGRHQCLLVGQGDIFPRLDSRDGGTDAHHPDNRRHKDLRLLFAGHSQQPVHTGENRHFQVLRPLPQISCVRLIGHRRDPGRELPNLLFQERRVMPRRQGCHREFPGILPHHIQSLGADGSRGTQNRYLLHFASSLFL